MTDAATHDAQSVPRAGETRPGWSAGCFGCGRTEPPAACLEHCLRGDATRAPTDGCPMVRRLAGAESSSGGVAADADALPVVCEQGYHVRLFAPREPDQPSVLILTPAADAAGEPDTGLGIQALRRATVEAWRLNRENEGLADEVLRCYEQVNLIFDIAGEVAVLTEAQEVRRVLLAKLRYLYGADAVVYVDRETDTVIHVDDQGRIVSHHATPELRGEDVGSGVLPPKYESARERLEVSPRVFVLTDGDEALTRQGLGTSLWGPLREGGEGFAVVGVVRREKPFQAGDMLLLDSTLTFGSHILGNLHLVEQLQRASFEAVRALVNAIDQKDPYTCGHSERVGFLARAVGRQMGLGARQLQELEWGGLLHDIGKIGIREAVLNKPGRLSEEEYGAIKHHPARGYAVLRPVESLQGVLDIVLHHHETPDGAGYPDGLAGEEIPLLARIVHVVDAFDALTSTRSYRKAFSYERAIALMQEEAGTKLDAEVVEVFLAMWSSLPTEQPDEYARWFASQEETQ